WGNDDRRWRRCGNLGNGLVAWRRRMAARLSRNARGLGRLVGGFLRRLLCGLLDYRFFSLSILFQKSFFRNALGLDAGLRSVGNIAGGFGRLGFRGGFGGGLRP